MSRSLTDDDGADLGQMAGDLKGLKSAAPLPVPDKAALKKAAKPLVDTKIVKPAAPKMSRATYTVSPAAVHGLADIEKRMMLRGRKTNASAILRAAIAQVATLSDAEIEAMLDGSE